MEAEFEEETLVHTIFTQAPVATSHTRMEQSLPLLTMISLRALRHSVTTASVWPSNVSCRMCPRPAVSNKQMVLSKEQLTMTEKRISKALTQELIKNNTSATRPVPLLLMAMPVTSLRWPSNDSINFLSRVSHSFQSK